MNVRPLPIATALLLLAGGPAVAHGAAPDGAAGSWADAVTSSVQGKRVDGSAVLAQRSDPATAVGPAEKTVAEGTFFSLGVGGSIVLRLDNPVCDAAGPDVHVEESTNGAYVPETAQVDVSPDGVTWTPAARALQHSYSLELPDGVTTRFVRVVDTTDGAGMADYDGFDVDGVQALHATGACSPGTDGSDPTLDLPPAVNVQNDAMGLLGQVDAGKDEPIAENVVQGVCGSGRKIHIRLRVPARLGSRLRSAKVSGGRGVKVTPVKFRRGRYRATIDLAGLRKGRYTLRIAMVGRNGEKATSARRYRACTSGADYKRKHPRPRG